MGLHNISQKVNNGRLGWPEKAPFDSIVINAGLPFVPEGLISQLKEGGVLIAPVGPYWGPFRLTKIKKSSTGNTVADLGQCYFPPLADAWSPAFFLQMFNEESSGLSEEAGIHGFWDQADDPTFTVGGGRLEGDEQAASVNT
jgi:hypothetical protein